MAVPGRQRYGAVTGIILFLAAINAVALYARKLIPPPPPNPAMVDRGDFLATAALQPVKWKPASAENLAEAQRLGKPVLLVVGSRASELARAFDERVFNNQEIAERVNREFVPLRVDIFESPEWRGFFLPLTKARGSLDPDFDIVVLDTNGRLVSHALIKASTAKADETSFNDFLGQSLADWHDDKDSLARQQNQEQDIFVEHPLSEWPTAQRRIADVESLELQPWDIRLLMVRGEKAAAQAQVNVILSGPSYDWQSWGFFTRAIKPDWSQVGPTKDSMRTHDMGVVLARIGFSTQRTDLLSLARECLEREGFQRTGMAELHAPTADGRITDLSIPASALRERLGAANVTEAFELWSLDPNRNPQMLPFPRDLVEWQRARTLFDQRMGVIRQSQAARPSVLFAETAWFEGYAAARVLEGAVLLRDDDLLKRGQAIFSRARRYRSGEAGLIRIGSTFGSGTLADYLGFAEAAWWMWVATGDEAHLREGVAVMRQMQNLFLDSSGTLSPVLNAGPIVGELRPNLPLWRDAERASDPSRAAVLLESYGVAVGDQQLRTAARNILDAYGAVANRLTDHHGAIMSAGQWLNGRAIFVVSGPDSKRLWRAWSLSRPGSLVVVGSGEKFKRGVWKLQAGILTKVPDDPMQPVSPPPSEPPSES